MYAVIAQAEALNDVALFGTPGTVSFATAGTKPSRGATVMDGVYYCVSLNTLYSIDKDGNVTSIGTIGGSKRCVFANNGEKLCIVVPGLSGFNAYVYNATTDTLVQVSDVDYINSSSVWWKDGYYNFSTTAGDKIFTSALNDPLTFDALDFGAAELFPDDITVVNGTFDEMYIFGEETTELFQNVGGSGWPWQRIPGASFEKGCHGKYTPIVWDNGMYFVGGGKNEKTSIYLSKNSSDPIRISTDAIDNEIQKFTMDEIGESFSFTYSVEGNSFVGFTFRSINTTDRTFVYNVTASNFSGRNVWLEQQSGISDASWRINSINFVYDKLLVSDFGDGRIGYLCPNCYTEYSSTILRSKVTGPFNSENKSLIIHKAELILNSGEGLISGQGSDPQIMMDYSNDGARTWSNEFWRPIGKIGEYGRRSVWRRLGRAPAHRVWRFRSTDPIKTVFIKLDVEFEYGD
jgi:hypothetical protein